MKFQNFTIGKIVLKIALKCALLLSLYGNSLLYAQTQLKDETTGLAVNLPSGLSVSRSAPRPRQDVVFSIRSDAGQPVAKNRDGSLCALAFAKSDSNASLTQKEINDISRKPEWRNLAKATFELAFNVQRMEAFTLEDIDGVAIHASPKENLPDQDVFMHVSLAETPRGRTTLACVTTRDGAQSALPVFEAIRSGVQPPR